MALPSWAAESVLTEIDVLPAQSGGINVDLYFSGGVPELRSYRLAAPPRVMLDLAATQNGLANRRVNVDRGGIERITAMEGNGRTRLVVNLREAQSYTSSVLEDRLRIRFEADPHGANSEAAAALEAGRTLTVDVQPVSQAPPSAQTQEKSFDGELLSLNFQDVEVRSVLATLAQFTGLNLVTSDSVAGRVTLNLNDVPWDQALALILQTQGLSSREQGNVILVAPAHEMADLERQALEARHQRETLLPLVTEFIEIKYARADDLAQLLSGGGSDGFGLLTERGRVSVDHRTNTLLVQDIAVQVRDIARTIDRLDVAVRQVQIEARIVIARDTASRELGINWGMSSTRGFQQGDDGAFRRRNINPNNINRAQGGLAVDLGAASGRGTGFSFGYLSGDILLDLELRALESEGKSQTISQPRIITANQRTARISQGEERAFQRVDGNDNLDTEFKEAELSLEVTPQITPDNRIIMDLVIKNDSFRESEFGGEPPIDTNQIETQVLVDNGQTVVLGGILTTEELRQIAKTPLLGDIPLLGRLFRYTEESNEKVELLVFITPRLLDDGLTVR